MARMILARTWFECGEYQKAVDAINEAGYKTVEGTFAYSYTLYVQSLSIRGMKKRRKGRRCDAMSLICYSAHVAMSLDLLHQNTMEAYDQLASTVNQSTSLIDHVVVDWAEEGLYRGTLLALSDRYNLTICV